MIRQRFWIRKDRESYFLAGVILTFTIGGFLSSNWHAADRREVRKNVTMKAGKTTTKKQQRKLRDVQYIPAKLRVGTTQYYRVEARPSVPKMGE